MSYGISIYGLADDQYKNTICLIQKRAIRLISNAPHNAHSKPLFKKLKILNFDNTKNLQQSVLMWEQEHGYLPACFNSYLKKVNRVHDHNTRSSTNNQLAENILVNTNKMQFKNKMKEHLINN